MNTGRQAAPVLSEAEIPLGIAASISANRLGLLDYLDFQNLNSDTQLRNNVAGAASNNR
jgi:uncharacterized protein YqfA (UPF0365 family)